MLVMLHDLQGQAPKNKAVFTWITGNMQEFWGPALVDAHHNNKVP
jgi:hypothetical protein